MEKHKIIVPKGIRYVGELDNGKIWYNLSDYGEPHILNKKLTGCGYTEYCLKNKQNIILVSPRRFLLENKEEQHPGSNVYYVKNELETSVDYELDLRKDDLKGIKEKSEKTEAGKEDTVENLDTLKKNLRDAIRTWNEDDNDEAFKILVTYDSFRHVKDALEHFYEREDDREGPFSNILPKFQIVVDEFQSIFMDSRFKSETEIELLDNLKGINQVCFVSATPILDKYLERLDEFKDLPYYEFDWEAEDPGRVQKPKLEIRFTVSNLNQAVNTVIGSYLNENFETRIDSKTGKFIESKEATLFFNSVGGICQAIRTNMLHLDQCNVLCANTSNNQEAIKKAFNAVLKKEAEGKGEKPKFFTKKDRVIGKIPTKGKPHKMFTFCTRTVYLGADFYSTNARTFIFSDSNIDCLAVDISMDLEQIIGRQRLDENPWKNSAVMYVKTTKEKHKMTQEEFDERIKQKMKNSNNLLSSYNKSSDEERTSLANNYQKVAKVYHYRDDYVAVTRIINKTTGQVVKLQPVFNNLVLVTEERAFEMQQKDYVDRFSVFSSIHSESRVDNLLKEEVKQEAEKFNSISSVFDKLHYLLDYTDKATEEDIRGFLELIPPKYKEYYTVIGPEIIRKCSCREADIKKEWLRIKSNGEIEERVVEEIYGTFFIGKRYSNKDIKAILKELYDKIGYQKTAKATDLDLLFVMKNIKYQDSSGKWIHGLEILGRK